VADAATFLVGALVALTITIGPLDHQTERDTTWRELRAGLALARRSEGLRWTLVVIASVYLLWALFGLLEPLYVRDVLRESDTVFALLQTVYGVGLVLTSLALARIGERIARPRYVAIAVIVSGLTAAIYLGTRSLTVAFIGVFLWGADVAFFYVPAKTLLQRYAPIAFHGRILSLNQSLEPLAGVIVTPLGALVLGVVSVRLLGVLGGALATVGGVMVLLWSRRLGPVPVATAVDPSAGSARDAVALGGSTPG
jgi:predicted MFS family arabinose efflux permease